MNRDISVVLFTCAILLIVTGCESAQLSPTPTDSDGSIPTSTIRPSEMIPTPISTETVRIFSSQTPSPAALFASWTPSMAPSQAPTQSWTPHPTLSSDEKKQVIQELLVTNGDCWLPCWWGLTPGKTTWGEAWAILSPLMADLFISPLKGHFTFYFWAPIDLQPDGKNVAYLIVRDNKVESIQVVIKSTLQEFLTTNGPPDQIRLFTDGTPGTDPSGFFILALYYPEKGILAYYEGDEQYGDIMDICTSRITTLGTGVLLWSPESEISFDQALELSFVGELIEYFYTLEDYSAMTASDFYETYVKPENADICLRVDNPRFP